MDELLDHIKQENTLKKLSGDYIFYSTSPDFWEHEGVSTVAEFEHWKARVQYEKVYRESGHRGFLPICLHDLTTEQIYNEIEKLRE